MAKPTTYATPICIVLSILVLVGIIVGVVKHNPLIIIIKRLKTLWLATGMKAYLNTNFSRREYSAACRRVVYQFAFAGSCLRGLSY